MMKTMLMPLGLAAVAGLLSLPVPAAESGDWSYRGERGPEHWGRLQPSFAACSQGRNQSPVDIRDSIDAALPALGFDYRAGAAVMRHNGHAIQVDQAPGSRLKIDGRTFELQQFHFHTPAENRIEGQAFPLEAHLVHADAEGALAVVAVMFEAGAANPALQRLVDQLPGKAGEAGALAAPFDAGELLPPQDGYFRFNGSLTTPPCSEGVRWLVMKTPVSASTEQIARLEGALGHANNRPLQPLNARIVID